MIDIKTLTYCELDLEYNRELFCQEVDQHILPSSVLIEATAFTEIERLSYVNDAWNMVSTDDYHKHNSHKAWMVNSLIYSQTDEDQLKTLSIHGSIVTRNKLLGAGKWAWKEEFAELALTKFVKQLPLVDIIHARILCLFPGKMAAIHRDNRTKSLTSKLLSDSGYVTITLNLSDGGQPLFYSLVSDENSPRTTNAAIYAFNDYNLHGVPYVNSIRRQVRITGKPTEEFFKKLKLDTLVTETYDE
jgi:hypothetical protein